MDFRELHGDRQSLLAEKCEQRAELGEFAHEDDSGDGADGNHLPSQRHSSVDSATSVSSADFRKGQLVHAGCSALLVLLPFLGFFTTYAVAPIKVSEGDGVDHGISIGVIYGAVLSVVSGVVVVRTYFLQQAWRRQHNTTLFFRTVADLLLSLRLLLVPIARCLTPDGCKTHGGLPVQEAQYRSKMERDRTVCDLSNN